MFDCRKDWWKVPLLISLVIALVSCTPAAPAATPTSLPDPTDIPVTQPPPPVTLSMGSWRIDDIEQMNHILAEFHAKYPNITIEYQTYDTTDVGVYNPIIESMLKQGKAPDLFYLTSYGFTRKLSEEGYLESLQDLPGLKENFAPAMLAPWADKQGRPYGVPFIATSHGIYYNQAIFKDLGLTIPQTWEELLQTSQRIKNTGITPFANASGEGWPMAEIVAMNIAPNFIGGIEGRKAYLEGKRCFNDEHMLNLFQAIADLAPYLPENQSYLNYSDSLQLFLQGKAAMWLGGSWDIPFFESEKPAFEWSVFAVPPPAGQDAYVTFHLDAGMGLNAASGHKAEALLFLQWMTDPEFGALLGNELPGFFPMHTRVPTLENQHANTFLSLNEGRATDVRFTWEEISDGSPDAYTLIMNGAIAVAAGEMTPRQAADALQTGLAQWYLPAQNCSK